MCEYQIIPQKVIDGEVQKSLPMCEYTKSPCTYCVLGNSQTYNEAVKKEVNNESMNFCQMWTVDKIVYGIKIGYPAFDLNSHEFESNGLSELNESGQYYYEVIGNIHDSPELLEGVGNG